MQEGPTGAPSFLKWFTDTLQTSIIRNRIPRDNAIRNWFVHRGEDLPHPVIVADRLKKRSLVYKVVKNRKEYEIRAPALLWLEKIVVNVLMGFLDSGSGKSESAAVLRDQARESGEYSVKLREGHPSIQKGQAIDGEFAEKWLEMDP